MFMFVRVIKNISLIDNTDEKNVLKFIDNDSFINSVSKDFIEGDVLIATKKPTVNPTPICNPIPPNNHFLFFNSEFIAPIAAKQGGLNKLNIEKYYSVDEQNRYVVLGIEFKTTTI